MPVVLAVVVTRDLRMNSILAAYPEARGLSSPTSWFLQLRKRAVATQVYAVAP